MYLPSFELGVRGVREGELSENFSLDGPGPLVAVLE